MKSYHSLSLSLALSLFFFDTNAKGIRRVSLGYGKYATLVISPIVFDSDRWCALLSLPSPDKTHLAPFIIAGKTEWRHVDRVMACKLPTLDRLRHLNEIQCNSLQFYFTYCVINSIRFTNLKHSIGLPFVLFINYHSVFVSSNTEWKM